MTGVENHPLFQWTLKQLSHRSQSPDTSCFHLWKNMPNLIYNFLRVSLIVLNCAYRQYHNIFTHSSWIFKSLSAFRQRSSTPVTAISIKFSICNIGLLPFSHPHSHFLPKCIAVSHMGKYHLSSSGSSPIMLWYCWFQSAPICKTTLNWTIF